jgi:transposase
VPAHQAQRARVVLALAAGERTSAVAAREGCDTSTVWRACRRYERGGLSALLADGRGQRGRRPRAAATAG